MHTYKLVAAIALSLSFEAMGSNCDKIFSKRVSKDPILFLVDHSSEIVSSKCQSDPRASEFRATLTSDELRRSSSLLMNKCLKKSDPHSCRQKVNGQMEHVRQLNGGNFGQNEAEKNRQKLQKDRLEILEVKKNALSDGDSLYCCAFSSHIIFSDDKDHPLCESPASLCPGTRKLAPIPRSRTGIAH